MPIDTNDELWRDTEREEGVPEKIRQYLSDRPNQAFTPREISDEVVGTSWNLVHKEARLREEKGEQQLKREIEAGEYPDLENLEDPGEVDAILSQIATARVEAYLQMLVDEGQVNVKQLPKHVHPHPNFTGVAMYYTWRTD